MNTSIGIHRYWTDTVDQRIDIAAAYDRQAPDWDRTIERLGFSQKYRLILQRELAGAPVDGQNRILDVGTGTGELALAVSETRAERGALEIEVVGVDISAQMLEIARAKFDRSAISFSGIESNIESLPLADSSFDYVVSAHAIEHADRPLKVLSELERVLVPGGTLVIMMTRCNPITLNIQRQWEVQCARSQKLGTVLRDFGLRDIRMPRYPNSLLCNWLSFCCIARKPECSA